MRRYLRWIGLAGCALFFMASAPRAATAASLYFSPNAGSVGAGQAFTVSVGVSSVDQAMNAASGDISFSTSKLRVVAVSELGSIMSLWVKNPSFSNSGPTGDVHFEGIVLNPGYIGGTGTIIRITFQVVGNVGDHAALAFSSGSVLANDGNGTNILTSEGTADFAIVQTVAPTPTPSGVPAATVSTAPIGPVVTPTPPPVTVASSTAVNSWLRAVASWLSVWGLLFTLLLLLLIVLIIALIILIRRRTDRTTRSMRKELRADLRRIEKELEADRPKSEIDLSAPGMRKKQEQVYKEIQHLEEDIKKDLKE